MLRHGDCSACSDVDDASPPFWSPELSRHVVTLYGSLALLRHRLGSSRIRAFAQRNERHLIVEHGAVSVQIRLIPGAAARGRLFVELVSDRPPWSTRAFDRVLALMRGDVTLPRCAASNPSAERHRLVLRALDAWSDGASQREIAQALFTEPRVRRDWRDPRGHLRDVTRRLLRRGRCMWSQGYRQLLS